MATSLKRHKAKKPTGKKTPVAIPPIEAKSWMVRVAAERKKTHLIDTTGFAFKIIN